MRKFWVVMCKGNEVPTSGKMFLHHPTLSSALREAKRLSRKFPTNRFRVLECVGQAKDGGTWVNAHHHNGWKVGHDSN